MKKFCVLLAVATATALLSACSDPPPEVEGCYQGRAYVEVEDRDGQPDLIAPDAKRDGECD